MVLRVNDNGGNDNNYHGWVVSASKQAKKDVKHATICIFGTLKATEVSGQVTTNDYMQHIQQWAKRLSDSEQTVQRLSARCTSQKQPSVRLLSASHRRRGRNGRGSGRARDNDGAVGQ